MFRDREHTGHGQAVADAGTVAMVDNGFNVATAAGDHAEGDAARPAIGGPNTLVRADGGTARQRLRSAVYALSMQGCCHDRGYRAGRLDRPIRSGGVS